MKQYRVKITGIALADMEAIYDYIAFILQSPDEATVSGQFIRRLCGRRRGSNRFESALLFFGQQ